MIEVLRMVLAGLDFTATAILVTFGIPVWDQNRGISVLMYIFALLALTSGISLLMS